MFPRNKINNFYRLLCLICYIVVIYMINGFNSLLMLLFTYIFLGLCERKFTHIELIVITMIIFGLCCMFDNYITLKIILIIDYIYYFLSPTYDEYEPISKEEYIRFAKIKKKRKKYSNNIIAIYLTVHLVILFLTIMVGR